MRAVEALWSDDGLGGSVGRAALAPAAWAYAAATGLRNVLYDRGLLVSREPAVPALSVGNLSVGGTGKTPLAAWAAARLHEQGGRPAVVLRGYGGDEPLVHARLNPDVPVVMDADRVRGVARARATGADCAVLDDAFQHRRVRRTADWVLVSAEQWRAGLRLLPAGPLREGARALRRASVLVVVRKTASREQADAVAESLARYLVDATAVAVCHLAPDAIVDATAEASVARREPVGRLAGRSLAAVAAVGAPEQFFAQLRALGADVAPLAYPDHHAFTPRDVARIAAEGARRDGVICTLKDAVKLAPDWPRAGPTLWYVSQRAVVERGRAVLDRSLEAVLAARAGAPSNAGSAGPSSPAHGHRSSTAD